MGRNPLATATLLLLGIDVLILGLGVSSGNERLMGLSIYGFYLAPLFGLGSLAYVKREPRRTVTVLVVSLLTPIAALLVLLAWCGTGEPGCFQ